MNKLQLFIGKLLYNLSWRCLPNKHKTLSKRKVIKLLPDFQWKDYYKDWDGEKAEPTELTTNELLQLFLVRMYKEVDVSKSQLGQFKDFYSSLSHEQKYKFESILIKLS